MGKTFFISDCHLGAGSHVDPQAVERRVVAFLHSIRGEADSLYLLGDILDYWYEYRNCVPQGFVRFFGALAELADSGVKIFWYVGNHDVWLYDYLSREIGLTVVDPPEGGSFISLDGTEFFVGHGDGVGKQSLFMRTARPVFRSRISRTLYGAIHPRWTIGFARWWSRRSRAAGVGKERQETYKRRAVGVLAEFGSAISRTHPDLRYIVLGHHHFPMELPVSPECTLYVLSAWDNENPVYGEWDGEKFELKSFKMPQA
ncbi:MAG: UDP-2,3-diacylglucosamine diphosphatase [Muribaculaceae bacterium]|nr:UDP-2,3-diacylglucosamine diphosphatase [Muribaculaceae bacterium]